MASEKKYSHATPQPAKKYFFNECVNTFSLTKEETYVLRKFFGSSKQELTIEEWRKLFSVKLNKNL